MSFWRMSTDNCSENVFLESYQEFSISDKSQAVDMIKQQNSGIILELKENEDIKPILKD